MIKYCKGNIFDSGADTLVNPVNCVGTMGAGLAKQFRQRFRVSKDYMAAAKRGQVHIGEMWYEADDIIQVIHFPTKIHWKQPSEYGWIESGLIDLVQVIADHEITSIAIPALGCGYGDLEWEKVKGLMEKYLAPIPDVEILIYEPY